MRKALKVLRPLVAPIGLVYSTFEYLLLVLRAYPCLRGAESVHPLLFWSFGHVVIDPHMLAMRFAGRRLVILVSRYPGDSSNEYILDSFQGMVRLNFLKHTWLAAQIWQKNIVAATAIKGMMRRVLRFVLWLMRNKANVIHEYHEFYGPRVSGTWMVEYIDRLRLGHAADVKAPERHIGAFRRILERDCPELAERWFISLYLRRKFSNRPDVRDTDQMPYRVVISRIFELGGFTFLGGDTAEDNFRDLPGWAGYSHFNAPKGLADLYFLTQCRFLVGGHGGPTTMAASYNVPTLITNNAYYYLSGYRENQVVVNKAARWVSTGAMLRPEELFSRPVVEFSDTREFEEAGIELIDNSEVEIADALEEMVRRFVSRDFAETPYNGAYEWFRTLLPHDSVAYVTSAKPAISYLESLKRGAGV
jgi:putative glycosyltransferase (TIGR04372 family)